MAQIKNKMEKIGIVGFGVMGKAIAHNLSNAGYRVLINDKSDESLALAKKKWLYNICNP